METYPHDVSAELNFIQSIILQCGPRLPTSLEETHAAELIQTHFTRIGGVSAIKESFTCVPKASIGAILLVGSILLFVILPLFMFIPFLL